MFYYYVWVRSNRYHGQEPLTYSYKDKLTAGTIVSVQLQNSLVIGFISGLSPKPKFKTKPISEVVDIGVLPKHSLRLAAWLEEYYPSPLGMVSQQFLPVKIYSDEQPSEQNTFTPKELVSLNSEQKQAAEAMEKVGHYILHGITGSGKTRVYIELALASVKAGKSAVILTPEISLTAQLANSFRQVFGENVVVMHSQQTPKERYFNWLKCLRSITPLVVIGPRSALFSPLKNIGLIVLDEAHESAYKQEQAPQYLTSRAGAALANFTKSKLVLGSATPLVSDYYLAKEKNRKIIKLTKIATPGVMHKVKTELVDLRDKTLFTQSYILSQKLIEEMKLSLARNEQVLLYLNRRGTAKIVLCQNCGWQALCPHCDVALTYHGDAHLLRCHSCSYTSETPTECPSCGFNNVIFKSAGTKAVYDEVIKLFPSASVQRFDTDNLKADSFISKYDDIRSGKINILIGTQMVAKGLDLPKLSLVGVVLADTNLYLPDYTSQERTFQLINQVIGRIGRGHISGKAITQSYNPGHQSITYAVNNDYDTFYENEIAARKQFYFPPLCFLLKITVKRATIKSAKDAADGIKESLSHKYSVIVEGPSPAFHEKLGGKYQWQLVVKSPRRSELLKIMAELPGNVSTDIDPMDLL